MDGRLQKGYLLVCLRVYKNSVTCDFDAVNVTALGFVVRLASLLIGRRFRRPASKSPTSAHRRSHSQSKHKPKHSRVHSTSRSRAETKARRMDGVVDRKRKSRSHSGDRKLKKEPGLKKSSNKSHKKKSSKDQGTTSHRHKSKKHKSKSKRRRSLSSSPEDQEQEPSKRSKSTVDRNNPDVVDLTG